MKRILAQVIGVAIGAALTAGAAVAAESATSQPPASQPARSTQRTSQPGTKTNAADVFDNLAGKIKRTQPIAASQPATRKAKPRVGRVLDSILPTAEQRTEIEPSEQRLTGPNLAPAIKVGVDPRVLGMAPGTEAPSLRREGDYVRMRRGRILAPPDSGYVLFLFETTDEPGKIETPMVLVPCQTLQSMEELVHKRGDRFLFTLSGQVLQYHGVNYLVPRMQRPPSAATSQPKDGADQSTTKLLEELRSKVQGATLTTPATTTSASTAQRTKRPPDSRRGGRSGGGGGGGGGVGGVAPGTDEPKLKREGEYIRMRRGRIVPSPQGEHILFVFEADGPEMADPPMALVPCQTLASMEEQVRRLGERAVFVVSGQVLEYRGVNHLLPTMMKLAINRGNLRK